MCLDLSVCSRGGRGYGALTYPSFKTYIMWLHSSAEKGHSTLNWKKSILVIELQ